MKVKWLNNAGCLITSASGTAILCDPWLTPGAYMGSWYQWPPLRPELVEELLMTPVDAILITHLHPDHFDRIFLARYLRNFPSTRILIAKARNGWLRDAMCRLASPSNVIEVDPITPTLIDDMSIRIIKADVCDPRICGTITPCVAFPWSESIDSFVVFESDGQRICNANDAIAVSMIPRVAHRVGKVDLLMGSWGGAGPFPQCFPDIPDGKKKTLARATVKQKSLFLAAAANAVEARFLFPFAGQYVLGGKLVSLNGLKSYIPPDVIAPILDRLTAAEVLTLAPWSEFDLIQGDVSKEYIEPDAEVAQSYFDEIEKIPFVYETTGGKKGVSDDEIVSGLEPVLRRARVMKIQKCSVVITDGQAVATIDFAGARSKITVGAQPSSKSVTTVVIPPDLLRRLLAKKAGYKGFTNIHWNQGEVGSHFSWHRRGEYVVEAHGLLNFFGT